jgi:uncharacterized protein YeaO (DUF488 family)
MIKTKSVHSEIEASKDGLRILASRFRGRGMPASCYGIWMPNLGPSEELLRAFLAQKLGWPEFGRRYRQELFEGGTIDDRNRVIKNHGQKFTLRLLQMLAKKRTITVMCQCPEETSQCHRFLLQKVLQGKI